MGRRPALKIGSLYYIKIKDQFDPERRFKGPYHYIAEIIGMVPSGDYRLGITLSILASTDEKGQYDGVRYKKNLNLNFMGDFNKGGYCWERTVFIQMSGVGPTWLNDAVIENFKPEHLPLCINWPFGHDWIVNQMKTVEV
jgi:hypothetical protein